ncbi:MAG: A/G-specific adenine glycosylase [Acidimicrobiia bacterium]
MSNSVVDRNSALAAWYSANKRDLPWRDTGDPYLTLVSELMLQQTQVDRVIPKFEAFVARWPNVDALAASSPTAVLEVWSGLGYNSRALRLRDTAIVIAADGWPTTIEGLMALPGVGPYTAAAIGSMALGIEVAAVDTNLKRILSRWSGSALDGADLIESAEQNLGSPAGDWNQSLMDLGSSLCTPANPSCIDCPVEAWCTDPSIYEAPRPQGRFEGSTRQLRGVMVKAHVAGGSPIEAGLALGRSEAEVAQVLEALETEGLIPEDSPSASQVEREELLVEEVAE